ncbi:NAD(P)/FAD-dependent oxidoreductase [Microbulbifer marinus]|uniref:Ferredoxin--NADP reductase n=1 Tax=Microbulbifer marinus TaxID=658218 RepID=A0A1H4B9B2_9GAMM|nr:NAD(P)/FAD-dependent oxidoreductase [Microbulbifer marinus]SEA44730.1 thioredoxin reductase (NADPH) [Microbulbifer marinus]
MNTPTDFAADVGIIGAGPCGLFQAFELGLHGLRSMIFDTQPAAGGQCSELYPNKPIYDIPACPSILAKDLIGNLKQQLRPFSPKWKFNTTVTEIEKTDNPSGFCIGTSSGGTFLVKFVVIATGAGAMRPVRLKVPGIDQLEGESLFYRVEDIAMHRDKAIAVLGGGDAAFDWANALSEISAEVVLIHRSNRFRAMQRSVDKYMRRCQEQKALFLAGQVIDFSTNQNKTLSHLRVKCADQVARSIAVDQVLVCFGMSPSIQNLLHWGMKLHNHKIEVSTDTFESSIEGIFAIGDSNYYPGKRNLILSGFHEAALAAFAIKRREQQGKRVMLEYTTTSPRILERLGVSGD